MKYALVNGHVLDGTLDEQGQMAPRDAAVFVSGDRIVAVGSLPPDGAADYEVIDLKGAWVAPGLVNLHAHLPAFLRGMDTGGCSHCFLLPKPRMGPLVLSIRQGLARYPLSRWFQMG